MRILFTFIGGSGHLQPLLPVARAAAAAGHVVAVAGSARQSEVIRAAGFEAFATNVVAAAAEVTGPTRDLAPVPPVRREDGELEFVQNFANRGARRHATAVLELARAWRPDVVVRDEADFGSGIAAERLGLPCAIVLVLAAGTLIRRDLVVAPLDALRADHGLEPDPELALLDGDLVLSPFPASFRHPDAALPDSAFSYRPGAVDGARDRGRSATSRRAYFTLGTSFNSESGDLFERVLAGLDDFPGHVVTTVGRDLDPAELAPQPDHIAVERYVDQTELLPSCDLVVSHGGSGSVIGAQREHEDRQPVSQGADQTHNAERLVQLGAGIALDAATAEPAEVRKAVHTLLDAPGYRDAAGRIRAEIAAQPGPERTVPLLEALRR